MNMWLTMLAAGLLTYLTRLSFIALFGQRPIPEGLKRALRFVPPAVLSAIVFPAVVLLDDSFFISPANFRLIAALAAAAVAYRTRSVAATIIVGMAVLLILQLVVG